VEQLLWPFKTFRKPSA